MFTLVGWSESQAGTTTYQNIAAVPDNHLKVVGDYVYLSALNNLIGVYACPGSEALFAYLASPSLRKLAYYDLAAIEIDVEPSALPPINLFPESPIPLEQNEGLEFLIKSSATASVVMSAVAYLSDGAIAPVSGAISTFLATAGAAAANTVASKWSAVAITFRQTLPVGRYAVVGAKLVEDNAVAFRFIPIGESHRPGGIASGLVNESPPVQQRNGKMGVWFEFDSVTPPSVEILSHTAITADADLYLDMIKIA